MSARTVKIPGPDHPITVTPTEGRVVVRAAGLVLADTTRALTLREASYPPVQYIPREDVQLAVIARSTAETWCPYKGVANYFSLDGRDIVWTYEEPHEAVSAIRSHLAFYPDRVEAIDIS